MRLNQHHHDGGHNYDHGMPDLSFSVSSVLIYFVTGPGARMLDSEPEPRVNDSQSEVQDNSLILVIEHLILKPIVF